MKNNIVIKLATILTISLMATSANAGEVESSVKSILMHSYNFNSAGANGVQLVEFEDLPTNQPACATDPLGRMATEGVFDTMREQLFKSFEDGRILTIVGTGKCTAFGFETILTMTLK